MATPKKGGDWDEARMEEAMRLLNVLYVKARLLRGTIPKVLDPLVHKGPTPKETFDAFKDAASSAQADIKEFTEMMQDEETKAVFERVQKSQIEDPTGIKRWKHSDHPDWFSEGSK